MMLEQNFLITLMLTLNTGHGKILQLTIARSLMLQHPLRDIEGDSYSKITVHVGQVQ